MGGGIKLSEPMLDPLCTILGADGGPGGEPLGARHVTDIRNRGFRRNPGRGLGDIFGLFILEIGGGV